MTAAKRQVAAFDAPAEANRFTRQFAIDVPDAAGHQLRVFELLRTYGSGAPLIAGIALKEAWIRGMTDFTDLNGLGTSYVTYVMANGDRIHARGHFLAHRLPDGEEKGRLKNMTGLTVTGGTGRFVAIRGLVRAETISDNATFNQNHSELEYWFED
jgi:hypothetical protein